MEKLSLDVLLREGDVFTVTDPKDSDFGEVYVFKKRDSGYNIVDNVNEGGNSVAVASIPEFQKLVRVNVRDTPGISTSEYHYHHTLNDLADNAELLKEAAYLGLRTSFSKGRFSFEQQLNVGNLFRGLMYHKIEEGIIASPTISLGTLDRNFGMGISERFEKHAAGLMTDKEYEEPVYNKDNTPAVFQSLFDRGIFLYRFQDPVLVDGYGTFKDVDWLNTGAEFAVEIVDPTTKAPEFEGSDRITAKQIIFPNLTEASKHLAKLFFKRLN